MALGLDAEWVTPDLLEATSPSLPRVCVLQISTRDLAVVVDLHAWVLVYEKLRGAGNRHGEGDGSVDTKGDGVGTMPEGPQRVLDEELGGLLLRKDILKLGFGIGLDMKMLTESFPLSTCLASLLRLTGIHYGRFSCRIWAKVLGDADDE